MDATEWPCPNKSLKYDKGDNRHKHLGKHTEAQVVYEEGKWVGKCPKGFCIKDAQNLLENGIPEFSKTIPEKPRRIWSYYSGVIYAACSSESEEGKIWHGYPVKDEPPRKILEKLKQLASERGEEKLIKKWLRK